MKWLILITTVLVVGCGDDREQTEIDALLNTFRKEAEARGAQVYLGAVQFGFFRNEVEVFIGGQDLGNTRGRCRLENNQPMIEFDEKWWAGASDMDKEALMFHELGHCALGRGHTTWLLTDGSAYSIMHPNLRYVWMNYETHREHYLNELFGRAK